WLAAESSVATSLRALVDGDAAVKSANEIAWGFRQLVEHVAEERPVVVVFDDLQWAEAPLFDLVEHLVTMSRDAPIMTLVMARPELLERREGWGAGSLNSSTALLEPLGAADTATLIDALATHLDAHSRERVLTAAAGNPLFAEEMVAYLEAADDPEIRVPPTIQALLAARLDQLDPAELRCLERGSIEGQSFHRGAVSALTPDDDELSQRLLSLVRKDLLRPDRATLDRDEAFRFRHLLLRDAAYERLPKSVRAELHERFARWLDEHAPDLAERDHLVGYHLEQAYHYRAGLGPQDDSTRALAAEAASRLRAASAAQFRRQDLPSAIDLIDRAAALEPGQAPDVPLQLGATWAMMLTGRPREAHQRAAAVANAAQQAGDHIGALIADLIRVALGPQVQGATTLADVETTLAVVMPELEASGDDSAIAWGWFVAALVAHNACRFGDALGAARKCSEHANRGGDPYLSDHGAFMHVYIGVGPTPVPEALASLGALRHLPEGNDPSVDQFVAQLLALKGSFDEAEALQRQVLDAFMERGMAMSAGMAQQGSWQIAMARGDIDTAIAVGFEGCAALESMGERSFQSTNAGQLAEALIIAGRTAEAEEWANRALELADADDDLAQAQAQGVLGLAAALRGDAQAARRLAEVALELIRPMQAPQIQGEALLRIAEVYRVLGEPAAAASHLQRALEHFTAKGSLAYIERTRAALEALGDLDEKGVMGA
ncbi:MAG: hypothetical protein ACTHK4_12405, partial [Mycobacteriales bacterium]